MFNKSILAITAILSFAIARPTNTGYSGAPGTPGRCASACHGTTGGTITVSDFPLSYVPGQAYLIKINHSAGVAIANFNASIRVGTASTTAGQITSGLNTSTYSTASEPNGVHFTAPQKDSGNFTWTAPNPGVGDVRLYLGGLQGTSNITGQNSIINLTSNQSQGIAESGISSRENLSLQINPSITANVLEFKVSVPTNQKAQLKILSSDGRVINTILVHNSNQTIIWQPADKNGSRLVNGNYIACLINGDEQIIKKFTTRSH